MLLPLTYRPRSPAVFYQVFPQFVFYVYVIRDDLSPRSTGTMGRKTSGYVYNDFSALVFAMGCISPEQGLRVLIPSLPRVFCFWASSGRLVLSSYTTPLSPTTYLGRYLGPVVRHLFFRNVRALFNRGVTSVVASRDATMTFMRLAGVVHQPKFVRGVNGVSRAFGFLESRGGVQQARSLGGSPMSVPSSSTRGLKFCHFFRECLYDFLIGYRCRLLVKAANGKGRLYASPSISRSSLRVSVFPYVVPIGKL